MPSAQPISDAEICRFWSKDIYRRCFSNCRNSAVMDLSYIVEIKLPSSGNWFKYLTGIESREEAENIKREAKGRLKARVLKE